MARDNHVSSSLIQPKFYSAASTLLSGEPLRQILLLLLLATASIQALSAPVFYAEASTEQESLLPFVDLFIDEEKILSPEKILTPTYFNQFAPLKQKKLHFGFDRKVYWLRFSLNHQQSIAKQFLLEISPVILDQIDVYKLNAEGTELEWLQRSGGFIPYHDRGMEHPLHIFSLPVNDSGQSTYYIRIDSQTSINVQINLSDKPHFDNYNLQRHGISSLIYGLLFGLLVLQLAFTVLFKHPQHLIYAIYIASLMCFQGAWNGWFYRFFPTQVHLQEQLIIFAIYGSTALCFLFATSYLETSTRNPIWHKVLLILAAISGGSALTAFFTNYSVNGHIAVFHALIYTIIIFGFALYETLNNNPKAISYLVARSCSFAVIVVTLTCALGYINYPQFLQWSIVVSLGLEALLITLFMIHFKLNAATKQSADLFDEEQVLAQNRSYSDLIRKLSHDIRTPMSGISGMAELLLDSPLTESQRKQVLTIKTSGDSLLNLVANLSTSSVENGELELQQISFNLTSLVSECVDIYQAQAEENELELISDIHYSVPKLVRGDPNRLQQIIMHLLSLTFNNSKNGEIVVAVRISKATNLIEFDLVNTGIDNAAELEHTLTLYSAGHVEDQENANQHEFQIAKQLASLMGGQIGVERYQNNGLKIWFTANLPALALNETTEKEYDNILRKRRLLVVDDNETFRQVIQQQAGSWGMQISSARSGMEALAILRSQAILEEQFDVLIVDHQMPTMSGLQLAEKIQEDEMLRSDMLIIMLTGVTQAPSTTEARGAGIRRVLTKPVSAQSLKITLAEEFAYLHSSKAPSE